MRTSWTPHKPLIKIKSCSLGEEIAPKLENLEKVSMCNDDLIIATGLGS